MTIAANGAWYVLLTEPMREQIAVARMHEIGLELYVPIVRKRVPMRGRNAAGHRLMRTVPRMMFPGYAFTLAGPAAGRLEDLCDRERGIRGIAGYLSRATIDGKKAITLPMSAVEAIWRKQTDQHHQWRKDLKQPNGLHNFKPGDQVQAEDGPFFGMLGQIQNLQKQGRVEVLFDMLKVSIPADQLRAA